MHPFPPAPPQGPAPAGWLAPGARSGQWRGPEGLPNHGGEESEPDADFFWPPPPEIGRLVSAHATLRRSQSPWGMTGKAFIAAHVGLILTGALIASDYNQGREPSMDWLFFAALGAVVGAIAFGGICYFTRGQYNCTYVGEAGVARFTLRGSRANRPHAEVLLFRPALELRTQQTRNYVNGVYAGTMYNKTWTDEAGRRLLHLVGGYFDGLGPPKSKDPMYFAEAAEAAWCNWMFHFLPAQLEQAGFLHFNVRPGEWVRVGPGFFDFCLGNEVQRLAAGDIKSIGLHEGTFHIASNDARWFSSRGKFSFNYAAMANGRLFLLAVEKLIGYRLG
jgi:hypothetical protein